MGGWVQRRVLGGRICRPLTDDDHMERESQKKTFPLKLDQVLSQSKPDGMVAEYDCDGVSFMQQLTC